MHDDAVIAPETEDLRAPERVLRDVARELGVAVGDVVGPRRSRRFVQIRGAVMRELRAAGLSLPEIGTVLHRDHTTVLHHLRKAGVA